jgi:hypothetical protein
MQDNVVNDVLHATMVPTLAVQGESGVWVGGFASGFARRGSVVCLV